MKRILIFSSAAMLTTATQAHHSPNLHFDRGDIVEIAGTLTQAYWQNPHTQLAVRSTDENGEESIWLIEGRSASQFTRAGVSRDSFHVGDAIRIAGFRGRRNTSALFATNILLADGRELVTDNFADARWPQGEALMLSPTEQVVAAEDLPTDVEGIFRVWGPDRSNHGIDGTGRTLWEDSYPLTDYARGVQESWDRITDNPYIRCGNGMPAIMDLGTPMQFTRDGSDILLYLEEQDSERRIHMSTSSQSREANGPFGLSVGRWDGETLEVTTTDIDWAWFDQSGIPQSNALKTVERFTPSDDGRMLDYTLVASDPDIFTEPVELNRVWAWAPTETVQAYNCIWDREDL
jgi:hypothetical protein